MSSRGTAVCGRPSPWRRIRVAVRELTIGMSATVLLLAGILAAIPHDDPTPTPPAQLCPVGMLCGSFSPGGE